MINPNFYTQKIEDGETYGKFIIEPLAPSFGQSLGVALRRVLLSSLKGAAITNVKIGETTHLFSTIKGVKESVLDIVLNLKQLKFEVSGDGPFKVNLSSKGPKKIITILVIGIKYKLTYICSNKRNLSKKFIDIFLHFQLKYWAIFFMML